MGGERRFVVLRIEANDPGTVFDVAKRLKEKYLPGRPRVVPDKDTREIRIEGATKGNVEVAMRKYTKAFAGGRGHGGYRFDYTLEEVVVSEREVIEQEVREPYVREVAEVRRRQADLEAKWSRERREFATAISELQSALKREKEESLRARLDLAETQGRLSASIGERDRLSGVIHRFEETSWYRIAFQRLHRVLKRRWAKLVTLLQKRTD